jgi:hypothetical protein
MIVADQKPLEEIIERVKDRRKILVAGCNECVTVCEAGGRKEVGVLASALRLYFANLGQDVAVGEITLERQCDREYVQEAREEVEAHEVVISLACGVGCQFMAEEYATTPCLRALPGLRPVHPGPDRRHLPHRPLRQTRHERALRGLHQRQMRNQQRCRLRLAAHCGPLEGCWAAWMTTKNSPPSRTGLPIAPEAHANWSGRMCSMTAKTPSKLEKVLAAGHFAVTSECGPPRGSDPTEIASKRPK